MSPKYTGELKGVCLTSSSKYNWKANDVQLHINSETNILLMFRWDSYFYKTTSCICIKQDCFQLEIKAHGSTDTIRGYLNLFYNRGLNRILVRGQWEECGLNYSIEGEFNYKK